MIKTKKHGAYILLITLLILVTSCSQKASLMEEDTIQINRKVVSTANGGGYTYGIYNMDGEIETTREFTILSGESFSKILSFGNNYENVENFKLIILSNFQKVNFSVNNEIEDDFFDFTVGSKEHVQYIININSLANGKNDLIYMIIRDGNNKSLDDEFRNSTDFRNFVSHRCTVFIGELEEPTNEYKTMEFTTMKNENISGMVLTQNPTRLLRTTTIKTDGLEPESFYLHFGNARETEKTYAIILLYDWKIKKIGDQEVLYTTIPKKSIITIPFMFSEFGEIGIHNLTAIAIELNLSEQKHHSLENSLRIGIDVVSPVNLE